MSGKPYYATINDCAGEWMRTEMHATLREAMDEAEGLKYRHDDRYPSKAVVCYFNEDRCDCDTDGITDDEREEHGI